MNRSTNDVPKGDELDFREIEAQLDQIRLLENQLISLKRGLVGLTSLSSIHRGNESSLTFITLKIRGKPIAIPILFVLEVVQMVELIPTSQSIEGVSGLLNYHGDILAAIDIGALLGLPKFEVSEDKAVAVCRLKHFRFALLVDEIDDIVTVETNNLKVEEEVLSGSLKAVGVLKTNEQTSAIIDLWSVVVSIHERILSDDQLAILTSVPGRKPKDGHE